MLDRIQRIGKKDREYSKELMGRRMRLQTQESSNLKESMLRGPRKITEEKRLVRNDFEAAVSGGAEPIEE
jgi:hypothetical protein